MCRAGTAMSPVLKLLAILALILQQSTFTDAADYIVVTPLNDAALVNEMIVFNCTGSSPRTQGDMVWTVSGNAPIACGGSQVQNLIRPSSNSLECDYNLTATATANTYQCSTGSGDTAHTAELIIIGAESCAPSPNVTAVRAGDNITFVCTFTITRPSPGSPAFNRSTIHWNITGLTEQAMTGNTMSITYWDVIPSGSPTYDPASCIARFYYDTPQASGAAVVYASNTVEEVCDPPILGVYSCPSVTITPALATNAIVQTGTTFTCNATGGYPTTYTYTWQGTANQPQSYTIPSGTTGPVSLTCVATPVGGITNCTGATLNVTVVAATTAPTSVGTTVGVTTVGPITTAAVATTQTPTVPTGVKVAIIAIPAVIGGVAALVALGACFYYVTRGSSSAATSAAAAAVRPYPPPGAYPPPPPQYPAYPAYRPYQPAPYRPPFQQPYQSPYYRPPNPYSQPYRPPPPRQQQNPVSSVLAPFVYSKRPPPPTTADLIPKFMPMQPYQYSPET